MHCEAQSAARAGQRCVGRRDGDGIRGRDGEVQRIKRPQWNVKRAEPILGQVIRAPLHLEPSLHAAFKRADEDRGDAPRVFAGQAAFPDSSRTGGEEFYFPEVA